MYLTVYIMWKTDTCEIYAPKPLRILGVSKSIMAIFFFLMKGSKVQMKKFKQLPQMGGVKVSGEQQSFARWECWVASRPFH